MGEPATLDDCLAVAAPGLRIPRAPDGFPLIDTVVLHEVLLRHPDLRMSYDQFLELPAELHADWKDGQVLLLGTETYDHQRVHGFLMSAVQCCLEVTDWGTLLPRFQMRARRGLPGREVDLMVISNEHYPERVKHTFLDGPADVVFEVVSETTVHRDWVENRSEYAAGGVPEYWIVDAPRCRAQVCSLVKGMYEVTGDQNSEWMESTVVPRLRLRTEWLLDRRPRMETVLAHFGIGGERPVSDESGGQPVPAGGRRTGNGG